jgi:hypothetical protein
MKKNILSIRIISLFVIGILMLTMTSCKRNKEGEPELIPNAGFRISLSGTANPSTLYVPEAQPARNAQLSVRALKSTGEPADGFQVIFQVGAVGYLNDYKASILETTDGTGMAYATFFLPPGVNIRASQYTNVTVTLVDDGRLDNSMAVVEDAIPIKIIPYMIQGILIQGRITTPAGNGVADVPVSLVGGDPGVGDYITTTRGSGRYSFLVNAGWYGTITPEAENYEFIPTEYTFDIAAPIVNDTDGLDFIAIFAGGQTLVTDITTWDNVPIAGGTQVVNVYNGTGDASIGYIVVPDSTWIHVSPNSGATPGRFTITVDENTTGADRSGNVTVTATDTTTSSVTITINQLGGEVPSDALLAVDRNLLNLSWETTAVTINVYNSTTPDSINYIVTPSPQSDWITTSAISGSTPSTLTITVTTNTGAARTGQLILTPTSIGVSNTVTITVNQEAGPSLALNFTTRSVGVGVETFKVNVTNPTNSDSVNFNVTSSDSWIGFQPATANTDTVISITTYGNHTGIIRTGTVTFTGAIPGVPAAEQPVVTLSITQQGS